MVTVAAFVLTILAFAAVAYPLLRGSAERVEWADASEPNDPEAERLAAYRAIEELDAEYRLGHISQEDYAGMRRQYVDRAAEALWRSKTAPKPKRVRSRAADTCPKCGERSRPQDRFCGVCGQALGVRP